ncbi:LTA synthase family protein [Parabacteroides chongii]|uniref:LTA synthase family protein n=1 Tax=Parabacteroides chongii TaxID=2685834 RepID=UPI00240E3581|nr:LTA synthase family protein [Parabacteroides chongii]WFE82729.1 LTA synthase family protein [Parabacteroides chongii]
MLSTFTPFSKIETYLDTILVSLILLLPLICFRAVKTTLVIFVLLDGLFVANLMYFRTYFTAIPLDSYLLAGNLSDFSSSVIDSCRVVDLFFPLSTIAAGILWWRNFRKPEDKQVRKERKRYSIARYVLLILLVALIPAIRLWSQNGFKAAYERLQDAYLHTCNVPMYTIFGSLYYDYTCDQIVYTEDIKNDIDSWLARKTDCKSVLPHVYAKDNCVIILAESLESWVLNKTVEGQEITPNLNRILRDSSVIYAPHVLSQVKGGRSIDAQLLMCTGLLPINSGPYSIKFPESYYPSLVKAFKEKHKNARAYSLTVDKPMVWNQCIIAPVLGYDSLVSKSSFIQEEPVGSRRQVGDRAFLRQCLSKMKKNEVWSDSGNTLVQCVTYSGHNPFILPDSLKKVFFSEDVPDVLNRYMTMANYTDRAIGEFISRLKSDKRFENTLVVIMGDHEALGTVRKELCSDPVGKNILSDKAFVPLIILNAPSNMYYGKVMGQIDVYPTLLDLLGLNDYWWKGLGESIFNPQKPDFDVDSQLNIVGDTAGIPDEEVRMAKKAWEISDLIIRYDYLGRKLNVKE